MTPYGGPIGHDPANSAAGILALLDEEDDSLKLFALQQLDRSVHDFWFQISGSIATIEALHEDEDFSHRELAALVVSKVSCLITFDFVEYLFSAVARMRLH